MDLKELEKLAKTLRISSARDVSPRGCLDKMRRHLMYFMCAEDKYELTGTIEDFGGTARRTTDLAKMVFACFELADVLKIDLPGAIAERYGVAKPASEGQPSDKQTASTTEEAQKPSDQATTERKETTLQGQGDGKESLQDGHASGSGSPPSKEEIMAMYRKLFDEASSLELVENTWKKEISVHKALDGKDKGALYKHYANAKKRLAGK